jgi:uncharacterized protein (DUF488 family)
LVRIFTLGFTRKNAETFFESLRKSGARQLIDVRLNNRSQLAGFTKSADLAYFLEKICGMAYRHSPILAPTQELLSAYRSGDAGWPEYRRRFLMLMRERNIERLIGRSDIHNACLLCSEDAPEQCHRTLVAEYLQAAWGDVEIIHIRGASGPLPRTAP